MTGTVELTFLNRGCPTIGQHNNQSVSLRIAEGTVSSSNYANSSSDRSPTTLVAIKVLGGPVIGFQLIAGSSPFFEFASCFVI